MIKSDSKGFTLIELLVVVAILGLLATIVAVSLTGARGRARDGRRSSDIRQVELALELYYSAERQYPSDLGVLVGDYLNMATVPTDPSTGDPYCYAYGVDTDASNPNQYYHIGAVLENEESDLLSQDKDADTTSDGEADWTQGHEGNCTTWATDAGFDGDEESAGEPVYDRAVTP